MASGPNIRSLVVQYLVTKGISQATLAKLAGVSQGTVSRAAHGHDERHGRARHRLVTFIQKELSTSGADRVTAAFNKIWDGTDAHAEAVAKIIAACEGLRPIKVPPS